MDPVSLLLEAFFGAAIAEPGGRATWKPTKEFGWALTIVMLALSGLGMFLFATTLNDGSEIGAALYLLVPFGGTYVAAIAGARGAAQGTKAGAISTAFALAGGLLLWLMMSVIDLMLWR